MKLSRTLRRFVLVATLTISTLPAVGRAQSQPPPAADDEARLAGARDLNRQGLTLLEAGDTERALALFEESRALYPSAKNTANVAICLDRLGRFDEALVAYEELLLKFADGLSPDDRATVAPAMSELRKRVGTLLVTANGRGELFVDGRLRGTLPLKAGLRLNAGTHTVRVTHDGYAPFEVDTTIEAQRTSIVDATLKPLVGVGRLRVEGRGAEAYEVWLDGERVGRTPWEGTVPVGIHWVAARNDELGSAPSRVTVVEGQTVLSRPALAVLGPSVRIAVEPRSARLEIGPAVIGGGGWDGRLPIGSHRIVVSEPGYVTVRRDVAIAEGDAPVELSVSLAVDPDHPRWPRTAGGTPWLGLVGAYAGGPTLSSDIESGCPAACANDPWVHGLALAGRGGYRFPFGLALELQAGFVWLNLAVSRTAADDFALSPDGRVRYDLADSLVVRGPIVSAGVSYRRAIVAPVAFEVRATGGALFGFSSDPITGTASTPVGSTSILVSDRNETLTSAAPIVWPAATLDFEVGPVDLGIGAGALLVLADGPLFARSNFGATPDLDVSNPGAPGNSPLSDAIAGERAYTPFVLFVPEIRASVDL